MSASPTRARARRVYLGNFPRCWRSRYTRAGEARVRWRRGRLGLAGAVYWLADGFHRFYAAQGCERQEVECDVREGGLRDAILCSVGANAAHGLRRTNEDKRRAVMKMLNDPEWAGWPGREIARRCGVAEGYVRKLMPETPVSAHNAQIGAGRSVSRNGTTYTMNTAAIGRREPSQAPAQPVEPNYRKLPPSRAFLRP